MSIEIDTQVLGVIAQYVSQFVCIGIVVFLAFRIISRRSNQPRPMGIWILSTVLLTASIYDLSNLLDYQYNRELFSRFSDNVFKLRYYFSFFLRGIIVVIAIGLIFLKESARKAVVGLGIFTIATVYWKHPFFVFEKVALMTEQNYFNEPVTELAFPALPWISYICYMGADIVFASLLIYYFRLGTVKTIYTKT